MSKQRPDFDKIANELHGKSAFFQRQATPESPPEPAREEQVPQQAPVATKPALQAATPLPVRPVRRQMIRHPFELYMDQLDRLRQVAEDQRRHGEPGSMSKMVRDAIDRLLDEMA
ncbi:MAG: hypothetical protein ACR2OU_07835 [Thermomicrobiales bacterium]